MDATPQNNIILHVIDYENRIGRHVWYECRPSPSERESLARAQGPTLALPASYPSQPSLFKSLHLLHSFETAKKDNLEGGGGGNCVQMLKDTTSVLRLDAREVVVVVVVVCSQKIWKTPPPACIWMRGRWWCWETYQKAEKLHLQVAFGPEGGGGGGRWAKWIEKHQLQLTFECEGGGGGGRRSKTSKSSTSGSRLDAREVAVVAGTCYESKFILDSFISVCLQPKN